MRVTCPQCQCKGLLDTAPLLHKAHVTCVRCGANYEALLVEGAIETALAVEPANVFAVEAAAPAQTSPAACGAPETEEVLVLPQADEPLLPVPEAVAVLELHDAAQTELPRLPEAHVAAQPPHIAPPVQIIFAQTAPDEQLDAQADEEPTPALVESGSFQMPPEYVPQFNRAELTRPVAHDKYSLGVRLMRVSPLWLLVCGLAFTALVVALNGMTNAAEQLTSAARPVRVNTSVNQATNQSPRNQTNEPPAPAVVAKPALAQTDTQTPLVTVKPAEVKPAEVKPAEVEPAPVVSTPQTQTAAQGKFTLQVGAFNNTVEANEHAAHLQAAGFTAQVVAVELPKRGTWYRVQTGRFADRAEAARYGAQLRAKGAAANFFVAETAAQ